MKANPCRWCRSHAEVKLDAYEYRVHCGGSSLVKKCGTCGPWMESRDKAIRAWNLMHPKRKSARRKGK